MATDTAKLRIAGKDFQLDDLTLDEMIELEEACGDVPLAAIDFTRPKNIRAAVLVFLRRDDPAATLESAGGIKILDLGQNGKGAGRS